LFAQNKKSVAAAVCLYAVLAAFLLSCSTVPITGRKQLNIIPAGEMLSMSFQQYDQFLGENKLSGDAAKTAMVKRVGANIKVAVEAYFRQEGMSSRLDGYNWEFNLIENDEVNAWCMPGGKVVFYTGILPICQDEKGIAVVMGHEVAHAVAEHGGERMSHGLVAQMGGLALAAALEEQPAKTQQLWMTAFGLGAQVGVLLPYSRLQESEADHLGLIFMAMAGYDPSLSVGFWQRMASAKDGAAPPEFISTHPSDDTRIRKIRELLPKVEPYYKK
jgi:predicted Zn-dependent protease